MRLLVRLLPLVGACALVPAAHGATGTVGTTPTTPPAAEQPAPNGPGMYRVWACRTPAGAPAPVDGWTTNPDVPAAGVISGCASGGFLGVAVGNGAPAASASLQWKPAPGLEGVGAELWRTAAATSTQGVTSTPPGVARVSVYRRGAELVPVRNHPELPPGTMALEIQPKLVESLLAESMPGKTAGTTQDLRAAVNRIVLDPLPTGHQREVAPIEINAECAWWYGNYACSASHTIWAADMRLRDAAAPTLSNVSGPLLAAIADGSKTEGTGVIGFTARAQDVGAGVLRTVIEVDGALKTETPSSTISSTCKPSASADGLRAYLVQVPCPLDGIVGGDLDTRTLSDGEHAVRVLVEDAAGNQTVVGAGKLLVRNAASVGPGSPASLRGEPNGSSTGDGARLVLTWPATARTASTKPAVVRRCRGAAYARRHPLACQGRVAADAVERDWSSTASEPLRVQLTAADGTPVAGAQVALDWKTTALTPQAGSYPAVLTGADGTAEIQVDRSGGSRVITARWLARLRDTTPAAAAQGAITVRAATSLTVRKRVGPSTPITFKGELRGRAGALGDVPITLEVRNQGAWKTFETTNTDADGRWRARVTFAPRPGRYPVRVRIGKSSGYPYAPGVAAASTVTVHR